MGKNTTPEYKSASENRLTFPYTNTYLEVQYEKVKDEDNGNMLFEIWTCFAKLNGDSE